MARTKTVRLPCAQNVMFPLERIPSLCCKLSKQYKSHTICPLLPLLESARKRTAPSKVDLYDVFCIILYLLRNGWAWRALPGDFPKWRTVHSYFQRWSEPCESGISLLEEALKKSGSLDRKSVV